MSKCTDCKINLNLENSYKRTDRNNKPMSRCKPCFNSYCIERWKKRKLQAIEKMGNMCYDCKTSYPPPVYDFHHLEPEKKEFNWAKMRLLSKTKLEFELSKCILLCSNCHRLRHHDESI